MPEDKLEKRKILGMYKDSAWHSDKWLIGTIAKVKAINFTYKAGFCSGELLVWFPSLKSEHRVYIHGVKLSKKRY